jgi:polyhydroxyalkanoate synthesis repressor PhaR
MNARIIKKYPNRRLYDEANSKYVNFGELKNLLLSGENFKVIVDKTNEDQTSKVLLQIFLELELSGKYIFSDQALRSLIILNNSSYRNIMNTFMKNLPEI